MKNKSISYNKLVAYRKYLSLCKQEKVDNETLFNQYRVAVGQEKIIIRNKIVEANMPLVIKFLTKKYNYDYDVNPIFDMDDILQESSILLIQSIDDFDASKGQFSTFVFRKLESNIYYINGIANSPVRFSRGLTARYKKIKKYIDLDYDDAEISSILQIDLKLIQSLRPFLTSCLSLDELPYNYEYEAMKHKDQLQADKLISMIDEEPLVEKRNSILLKALNDLKDNDKLLLLKKYGLDGSDEGKILNTLKKEFKYNYSYIYFRYKFAIDKLSQNKKLKKAFYEVDSDFDNNNNNKEKTYYLQK